MNNVTTRFAPTVSGVLHLGSLWNAMLNWLYARKHSGIFNVRMDGHLIRGQRIQDRDSILSDLKLFGLEWNNIIHQADRLDEHKLEFKNLVENNPNAFYQCDCTINDIAKRNLFPPQKPMYKLLRAEKYPKPCRLQKLEIFDVDNIDVAKGQAVSASNSSRDCSANVLTSDDGSYSNFWSNTDIGNSNSPEQTTLEVRWDNEKNVSSLQMTFRDYPFLDYQIYVLHNEEWKAVARVNKPVEYFVEPRPAVPYPCGLPERVNFAPISCTGIKIDITRLPLPLDRPYHYDYHCKTMSKKLDWSDLKTVVRCNYNPDVYQNYLEFITEKRIPDRKIAIDSAAWFDGKPDLVFTSPYDDRSMGATHLIRGSDIYPFFFMEVMLTHLLGFKPVYYHHSMIVDANYVKYSKFIKSPAISSYLENNVTPGQILGFLAYKGGIVPEYPGEITMSDLLPHFDIKSIRTDDIIIDDNSMIGFIKNS